MPISTINNKGILNRFHRHKTNTQLLIYTIRGGSDEYNNNDDDVKQYNDDVEQYDDEYIEDFISSFEAEMADIRREAEAEAENEMQKLRGLIDRRGEDDIQEEEVYDIESEDYDENIIESNENEQLEDDDTVLEEDDSINDEQIDNEDEQIAESVYQDGEELDNTITDNEGEEEELNTIQDGDTLVYDSDRSETEESDEELPDDMEIERDDPSNHDDESEDTIDLDSDTEDEISGETVMVEDDDYLPYDEIIELPNESVVIGDYSEESEESDMEFSSDTGAATPEVDDKIIKDDDEEIIEDDIISDEIIQEVKSKTSKKGKKKSSKQGKEKNKTRITESKDEEDLSDAVGGDSVMLTQTEDEVSQPRQSGLLYYLRSDLGRALCLFAATVALAIMTKRMERQLLAADAAEAASSST